MNPNIIAGLINRKYDSFDMFSFDNRLKLQKFTYLLQSMFNLNIGYEFNWYHYGPYCMELTKDAFNISFEEIPQIKFGETEAEDRFKEFLSFVEGKDNNWLEIASSIHFLKRLGCCKGDVIETIKNKRVELATNEPLIIGIYTLLEDGGKI